MTPTSPTAAELMQVHEHFTATAAAVDAGTQDVREGLRWLGDRGLLRPVGDRTARVGRAVRLLRAVAAASLADAFVAWSQTMVVEYLTCCPPEPELVGVLADLGAGVLPGATALAPAIADAGGGAPVPVLAEQVAGGWTLTGPIPWASNLFPDAVVVVPARARDGGRLVAALRLGAPGVHVGPAVPLLALNSTGTSSIELDSTPVTAGAVLTRDLLAFLSLCRPTMLLTQAALALGVADGAIASTAEASAAAGSGPVTVVLGEDHRALEAHRDAVADELAALAAGLDAAEPTAFALARIDALHLAARAVELEGLAHGGTGFQASSASSRRRREAAFLPLQAPTLLQLRAAAAAAAQHRNQ
ncbi:acyl-CoA dehydrogenase family protein [Kineococcus arenarius]|uniref:acyl-CoA dehydrogenase family protein n=1 Tax=Kineococcus sp. SYSU DK007 TaxID=3383128 RepID=UPI003D7CC895